MGRRNKKARIRQNTKSKRISPILVLLAFLLGAVTAYAAFWRIRASKYKKSAGTSGTDREAHGADARADRELRELIIENPQQIKPYRPRRRVSAKRIFGRCTAVAAAAALVLTGLYAAPGDRVPVPKVMARESFGGIKQVVEEHDEDDPFVILDIVPGKAKAEIDGKAYDFSLGTIGYLAPGQAPVQQDLFRIFTGDDKESFYAYPDRKKLTNSVIESGYTGITYQEAYDGTGEDLRASVWSRIFDSVEVKHDENGKLTDEVPYPTGRLYARVEKRTDTASGTGSLPVRAGFDYNLTGQPAGSTLFSTSTTTIPPAEGLYRFVEGGEGAYQVIFEGPAAGTAGYRAEVIKSGSYDEVVLGGSYSDATGVYIVENGGYRYACTIGEFKGIPRPEPKPEKPQPENPTEPVKPTEPAEPTEPVNPTEPTEPTEPINPTDPTEPEPVRPELPEDGTYCILKFTYVETEAEEFLYQIREVFPISEQEGVPRPYDSYLLEKGFLQDSLNTVDGDNDIFAAEPALEGQFEYVGGGRGMYKLTRMRTAENIAAMTGKAPQDAEEQKNGSEESDAPDGQDADVQGVSVRAAESGSVHYVEVQNAPVYIRCTGGNDWLRRYVFNSLKSQDNDSDDFAITVNTVLAGDVTYEMVQEADLVYLEDGMGLYLHPDAEKSYIGTEAAGNTADGLADVSDSVITCLLEEAVQSLKPVIVDYGVIEDQDKYAGSNYQKLAKAFLKKDLAAFYTEMAKSGNLADNILMNVDKDLKDHPNKKDNDYHYVNRNIYLVNGTPLVGDDFPETMDKDKAKAGFGEVLAAIRAENVLLPEDEKISEKVSKAMAVQYIINYSLGLVGEYKDLSILELQPTANMKSDLHRDANEDKGSVVLFWQREDRDGEGQQILRSSKLIETNVTLSSVAAFNSSYQDINADYNMIFIGLDGQRLYHEPDKNGRMEAAYNDEDLNGKVYHTGDRVANGDTRYDASDITEQKKDALLDYLRAGYPIVVENDCFKGGSAQKADEKDINTKYIASDTQMYDFLKEAVAMGRSEEEDDEDRSVGIYTIEDVHSSAMFTMQLNAQRPKVALRAEEENGGNDSEDGQRPADMIEAVAVPEKPGVLRGTIAYRITSDRAGEDKAYQGSLDRRLYLDLNYDGVFAPEEEYTGYEYTETDGIGSVSVDFNEVNFGIVPWKLEVTDTDNRYRRASTQGCFTLSGRNRAKIRVLQILDNTANDYANLQSIYEDIENSMLAYYMKGAETILKMNWDIETVTPGELAGRIDKNTNYLSLWDVVVLGFGESGNPGNDVVNAVNQYIDDGGSVVVSSAGASADQGRLGIPAAVLGQRDAQTYGKLGLHSESKFRYEGITAAMFNKTPSLFLDRVNDGTISRWPYQIDERARLGGNTEVSMPDYLLDIGTARGEGQPYATAWFTLLDSNLSKGAYSSSPRDGRNNYYVYSKGNVVYVGQTQYAYVYDTDSGMEPEGDGTDECRIFVNALMAAYNAGVHRADVSIVAGFNGVNKVESVTVPFDVAFKEDGDAKGGILGETVDVYFRFTDNNIACDKITELSLFYKNAGAAPEAELLLPGGGINSAAYTAFTSPVWAVENNRLVEVSGGIVPDKVYRVKAPLAALQNGNDETSLICVLLTNRYTRAGQSVEALSMDSVSLNRAQMFLLE